MGRARDGVLKEKVGRGVRTGRTVNMGPEGMAVVGRLCSIGEDIARAIGELMMVMGWPAVIVIGADDQADQPDTAAFIFVIGWIDAGRVVIGWIGAPREMEGIE